MGVRMTSWEFLKIAWEWYPSVIIGCILMMLGYLFATKFEWSRRTVYFALGSLVLLLTLCGPLDVLADDYLFSATIRENIPFSFKSRDVPYLPSLLLMSSLMSTSSENS